MRSLLTNARLELVLKWALCVISVHAVCILMARESRQIQWFRLKNCFLIRNDIFLNRYHLQTGSILVVVFGLMSEKFRGDNQIGNRMYDAYVIILGDACACVPLIMEILE
jgi:hypothetical protein